MRQLSSEYLSSKQFIRNFSLSELEAKFVNLNIPRFRAAQVYNSVYEHRATSFESIQTIPKSIRELLNELFLVNSLTLEKKQQSSDGTIKFLYTLVDGAKIESVLIPSELVVKDGSPKRLTLCISTQAGCPLGCEFCATATLKLKRNLEAAEIIDQFMSAQLHSDQEITNVVFMGMGEPMLNYDNVFKAVEIFTDAKNNLLSSKRITLSTAGVVPGILRMADEKRKIKLALSLHATTNGMRSKLMPIARKHSLEELGNTLEYYYRCTKNPVTYEYILFDGLNDSDADVKRLAKLSRRIPSKVNVIPFHSIEFTHPSEIAAELKAPSKEKFDSFIKKLMNEGVTVMIRSSSGLDIDAACGQLALSHIAE